jgi:hypothetical protein
MHYQLNEADLDGWRFLAGTDDISAAIPGGLRLIIIDPITRREIINEAAMTWLRRAIMSRSIDVLMIDPFSRLVRGNENAVDVVDQLMERLVLLAVEANIAILVAQHTRKGGGIATDGVDALRGSSAVPDGARNAYGLTKPDAPTMIQVGAFGIDSLIMMTHLKGNLGRLEEPAYYRLVGVRLAGGDPSKDPRQVERGRWAHTLERHIPVPISQSITDPMRNAVMVVIDAQTLDKQGALVPFAKSTTGRSARNPIPACGLALQGVVHGSRTDEAKQLAGEVIKDLIDKGYVSVARVQIPSYKKATGARNGSNDGDGLFCHWSVTPWRQAASSGAVSPGSSAAAPSSSATPSLPLPTPPTSASTSAAPSSQSPGASVGAGGGPQPKGECQEGSLPDPAGSTDA